MNQRTIGYIEVLLSGVCFGFLGLFGKKAFEASLLPGEFLSLRFLFSSLILGLGLHISCPGILRIEKTKIVQNILLGVFGYTVFSSLYFYTLSGVSASLTVLLLYLYPALVTIGGRIFYKEKIGSWGLVALFLSMLGSSLLVWGEWSVHSPHFIVTGFLSAIFYSAYILFSRSWLQGQNSFVSSFYIQSATAGTLALIYLHSFERVSVILSQNFWLIVGVAFICTVLAVTLFLSGLKKISAAETAILSTTEPLVAVLVAAFFLNEQLAPLQMVGGLMILSSVVLVSLFKPA